MNYSVSGTIGTFISTKHTSVYASFNWDCWNTHTHLSISIISCNLIFPHFKNFSGFIIFLIFLYENFQISSSIYLIQIQAQSETHIQFNCQLNRQSFFFWKQNQFPLGDVSFKSLFKSFQLKIIHFFSTKNPFRKYNRIETVWFSLVSVLFSYLSCSN